MANYPLSSTIKTTEDSTPMPRDGRQIDNTADGLNRVRKFHGDSYSFEVDHQPLTAAGYATLKAFYASNKSSTFYYIDPVSGTTYTVAFGSAYREKKLNGGRAYLMSVTLVQVA